MLSRTTRWASALDRLPSWFAKIGESHFCVSTKADGINVSYPVSIFSQPNTSNRYFGVSYE